MSLSMGESSCAGGMMRSMVSPYFKVKDTSKDPGFGSKYVSYFKYGDASGNKHGPWTALDKDPFAVSALLDSYWHGVNCNHCGVVELIRIFGKQGWGCDVAAVACPTFIYQGAKDAETPVAAAEFFHKVIKGSELIIMEGHGHMSIMMESGRIIEALVKKEKVAAPSWVSSS